MFFVNIACQPTVHLLIIKRNTNAWEGFFEAILVNKMKNENTRLGLESRGYYFSNTPVLTRDSNLGPRTALMNHFLADFVLPILPYVLCLLNDLAKIFPFFIILRTLSFVVFDSF